MEADEVVASSFQLRLCQKLPVRVAPLDGLNIALPQIGPTLTPIWILAPRLNRSFGIPFGAVAAPVAELAASTV